MNRTYSSPLQLAMLAAALVLAFASGAAPSAHAATDNSAAIAAIQAQLATLTAQQAVGTSTGSALFTADLSVGSTGASVTALQRWLIAKGFTIAAGATGSFGGQTRAAVSAWQRSVGVTPVTGYFGPKSRAAANANGATASTPKLSGGSGYLTNITSQGDVESVMSAGDDETKVLGVSVRAQGSDLGLARLDVQFDLSGSSGSTNLNSYVQSVSVYQDGTKLATMNPADGSYQNKVWTLRFNNLNGVLKQGSASSLYVKVTPVDDIRDSETDADVTVTIPAQGLRVVDPQGVSEQYGTSAYTSTFSINQGSLGTLNLTEASDNPKATTLKADTNNTTTNVTLLSFKGKTTYEDAYLRTVPVSLTVTGTTNVSDVVQSISLMKGSTVLSTKTVTTSGATAEVDFDNLNEVVLMDATGAYSVVATVRKIGTGASASAFDSGDTVQATVDTGNGTWDVVDDTGYGSALSGIVLGGIFTLQQTGITVTQVAATANTSVGTTAGSGDNTQYAITFKTTAGDSDLYLARAISRSTAASVSALTWATTTSSNSGVTNVGTAGLSAADTNSSDTAGAYKVPAGSSRTFTLNVTLVEKLVGSAGFTGVQLTGIAYGTTTSFGSAYTSGLDQFKTADKSMTVH
ncbi:MAG: baaA1 [Parcubacteria group bacterium]|nr:baaA1 [Parcubacteria group bacterium]